MAFITTFVSLFALVIAITKDLPDVEGDRRYVPQTHCIRCYLHFSLSFSGAMVLYEVPFVISKMYAHSFFA